MDPTPPTASAAPTAPPPDAPASSRRRPGWMAWLLALVLPLLAVAAIVGMLVAALTTATGTAWLLRAVPRLTVLDPQGPLLGDFSARRVHWDLSSPGRPHDGVTIDGLAWQGLRWNAEPSGQGLSLQVTQLALERLHLRLPPAAPTGDASPPPSELKSPLHLRLRSVRIGELSFSEAMPPMRELTAQLELGSQEGRTHRLDVLSLRWDRLRLHGQAELGALAPLELHAALDLDGELPEGPTSAARWQARLEARGPLAQLPVSIELSAAEQSLRAEATLTPFAPAPLERLDARFEALDLAALFSAAPRTALSGQVHAQLGHPQPGTVDAAVRIRLRNARPDRWDASRLPLRELVLDARSPDLRPQEGWVVERFEAVLGPAMREAGRLRGEGRGSPSSGWSARLELRQLDLAALDGRLPALRLSGPLELGSGGAGQPVAVRTRLDGSLPDARGMRQSVALSLDGEFSRLRSLVRELTVRAGSSRAEVQAEVDTPPGQAVQARVQARWQDLDPRTWWPALGAGAAAHGEHRLSGQAQTRLTLPPRNPGEPLLTWMARWRGQAELRVDDSRWADLPVQGLLLWQAERAGLPGRTEGQLRVDANRLTWNGELPGQRPAHADDTLTFNLDAAALDRVAPLLHAWQPEVRLAGALRLNARIHWGAAAAPQRLDGQLQGRALRWNDWLLQSAEGHWDLASAREALQRLELRMDGLQHRDRRIDTVTLQLEGPLHDHRLRVDGRSNLVLPWAAPADAAQQTVHAAHAQPVQLQLQVSGSADLPRDGAFDAIQGWQGRLQRLVVGPVDPQQLPWLDVSGVPLQWEHRAGQAARFSLGAGQARLRAGRQAATLRWDEVSYQAAQAGQSAVLQAQARLDPLPIAPLLRDLQPEFGWTGDLELGASLRLRSAPSVQADVDIVRVRGDLQVEEPGGLVERLDLTELRLSLQARDGLWRFTQAMAGARLGRVWGEQTVQARPQDGWPSPEATLRGFVQADVDNLGAWAAWVPAGWRLGGQLRLRADVGGRWGAPQFTGEVRARDVQVRNLLQGIHLRDGELHLVMQGDTARIETLRARAGEGEVQLHGQAQLGQHPRAQLQVRAERFSLLSRVDRRMVLSGSAQVVLEAERLQADGDFRIDEGLIDISRADAPSLSDDVVVRRTEPRADEDPRRQTAPRRAVALNLRLDAGERLRLRGRGLDTRLTGALRLTSPGGRPALHGDIRTADGTYAAYGQKLTIDKGVISFVGAPDNPRLDIEATRPNTDIRVGVAITGTAESPRVRLFSEPEMSDTDKLSWLVLGRGSGQLARAEAALLQRAVLALVAGEGESPTGDLTRMIGLDELSVRQEDSAGVAETIVSVGKQLSRRWYVGYERSLNATSGTWQLIYRAAQRFTVRAQAGIQENALDFIWTWRW